jgi:ribokinase
MIVVAGSLNMDLVGRVPRLPTWGETVMGDGFARFAGGKGGNQAVAAARLGAPVAFAGAVGDDPFGAELRAGLQAEGIDVSGLQPGPAATGCALIHVRPDGDNAISVLPGANLLAPLPPAQWPAAWRCLLLQLESAAGHQPGVGAGRACRRRQVMLNAAPMVPLPGACWGRWTCCWSTKVELLALVGRQPDVAHGPAGRRAAAARRAWWPRWARAAARPGTPAG